MKTYIFSCYGLNEQEAASLSQYLEWQLEPLSYEPAIIVRIINKEDEDKEILSLHDSEKAPCPSQLKENWCVDVIYEIDRFKEIKNIIKSYNIRHNAYYNCKIIEKDWLLENRQSFPPIQIGRFFIHQAADANHRLKRSSPGQISLEIAAAMAFGTGTHETTAMCLNHLENLKKKKYSFQNIIDIGCGTGILTLAATNLFVNQRYSANLNHIQAGDVDNLSFDATVKNAMINKLSSKINVFHGAGFPIHKVKANKKYNLLMANILAIPLIKLAPYMRHYASKNAIIILSGLNRRQKNKVVQAYLNQGFCLCNYSIKNDWCALVMQYRGGEQPIIGRFSSQSHVEAWEV